MYGCPRLARRIDHENGLVVIRIRTFCMKESSNGSNQNADEEGGRRPASPNPAQLTRRVLE